MYVPAGHALQPAPGVASRTAVPTAHAVQHALGVALAQPRDELACTLTPLAADELHATHTFAEPKSKKPFGQSVHAPRPAPPAADVRPAGQRAQLAALALL